MSETTKWNVHILGPDDILPAESFEDACRQANEINRSIESLFPLSEYAPQAWASPVPEGRYAYWLPAEASHDRAERVIDADHLAHQREWSSETFGPGERTAGVLDHIAKEMEEIRSKPDDVTEWADLLILAFDGAMRAGHEPQAVIDAIKTKQARNQSREWPDWRTADPNKAIEHVREESR